MKYIYYAMLSVLFIGTTSCNKILNKEPLDFLSPQAYYQTETQLESHLAGVYDVLGHRDLYGQWMLYRIGLEADEGYYAPSSPLTGAHAHNFTAGEASIERHWGMLYTGVNRANTLLANIDLNEEIDSEFRDQIRGETMFLRGYYYFLLVQYYGGVPMMLEPITNVYDVDLPRSTAREVYEQILLDMETAEGLVAEIDELGYGGRVSKTAVQGMLARVCLHMAGKPVGETSKFEAARTWAKKVIDGGKHSLNPVFSQIFINYAQDIYDINESIWEIEFWGNGSDSYAEGGMVGYVNGPQTTNKDIGNAVNGMRATAKLYYAYREGDLRRDWSIANFKYVHADGSKTFPVLNRSTVYDRNSAKFRREYEILTPKGNSTTPQNFPLLRYADVLLMFAEADAEINQGIPSSAAIEAVNMVRRRAWSTGIKSITITSGGTGYTTAPEVSFQGGGGENTSATALIENGAVTEVIIDLDAVTGRAWGSGYSGAPQVVFNGGGGSGATAVAELFDEEEADLTADEINDFRNTIQDERLRELAFETLRQADLRRWGNYVFEMKEVGNDLLLHKSTAYFLKRYTDVWDKYLLWPIPSTQISLNRALTQNPNW